MLSLYAVLTNTGREASKPRRGAKKRRLRSPFSAPFRWSGLEPLEQRVMMTAAFTDADFTGTWSLNAIDARGAVISDGAGAITGGNVEIVDGTDLTITGNSYNLETGGGATASILTNSGDPAIDFAGAISSTGDTLAMNSILSQDPVNDGVADGLLAVLLDATESGATADMAGTWSFAGPQVRGTMTFNAAGNVTASNFISEGGSGSFLAGSTGSVSPTGVVTLSLNVPHDGGSETMTWIGTLNESEDVAALNTTTLPNPNDPDSDNADLIVAVKHVGTYTNADLLGEIHVASLHGRGSLVFDGAGRIIGGEFNDVDGGTETITGTYKVASNGVVTLKLNLLNGDGETEVFNFTGGINGSKNAVVMALTQRNPDTGNDPDGDDGDMSMTVLLDSIARQPIVRVIASDNSAAESGTKAAQNGAYTFTRQGTTTEPLTVKFARSGTADVNNDYVLRLAGTDTVVTNSVTIPAGALSVVVTLTPLDDTALETVKETAVLTLTEDDVYVIDPTKASAVINIADTTLPIVNVEAFDGTASEAGGNNGVFRFTRIGPTTKALTIQITIGGTATFGSDYTLPGFSALPTTITFPKGKSSVALFQSTLDVTVQPVADGVSDSGETVTVTINAPGAKPKYRLGANTTATVTILEA